MTLWHWLNALLVASMSATVCGAELTWRELADPVVEDGWIRPADDVRGAKPVWGRAEGLRIGLAPLPGPRGLLRVYTPYVGQPDWRMINFIAVEPIAAGRRQRSFSELEQSKLADGAGKVMWSVDHPDDWTPRDPVQPARGVVGQEAGTTTLTVFVGVERFDSGAAVYLRLTFRADRPYEVQIATFRQPDSARLSYCVVTATMGNYARLRQLHLAERVVTARDLYSGTTYGPIGFAPHKSFGLGQLPRATDGTVMFAATSDEHDPTSTPLGAAVRGWRYVGRPARQYWSCRDPHPQLRTSERAPDLLGLQ